METNIEIPGFKISKIDLNNLPRFGYVSYKRLFCEFSIATDSMGTQIFYNGTFFGPFDFKNIEDAINWVKEDNERLQSLKRVYTKAWFRHFKYLLSWNHTTYLYWKIRHHFDPSFYLGK
jgi:hypothetical protein